jgi:hypothetical protein
MAFVGSLNASDALRLWLYTSSKNPNNHAIIGISRALRHEHPLWNIQLVVFESLLSRADQDNYIQNILPFMPDLDPELFIDEGGSFRVSRIRTIPQGDVRELLGKRSYGFSREGEIWVYYPPVVGSYDAEVEVLSVKLPQEGSKEFGFAGIITQKGSRVGLPMSSRVVGISRRGPMASKLVRNWGDLAVISEGCSFRKAATAIQSLTICFLAINQLPRPKSPDPCKRETAIGRHLSQQDSP